MKTTHASPVPTALSSLWPNKTPYTPPLQNRAAQVSLPARHDGYFHSADSTRPKRLTPKGSIIAVGIVVDVTTGLILGMRRVKDAPVYPGEWSMPMGRNLRGSETLSDGTRIDETGFEAVQRKIREEAGLVATHCLFLGALNQLDIRGIPVQYQFFLGLTDGEAAINPEEHDDLTWQPASVWRKKMTPEIRDFINTLSSRSLTKAARRMLLQEECLSCDL